MSWNGNRRALRRGPGSIAAVAVFGVALSACSSGTGSGPGAAGSSGDGSASKWQAKFAWGTFNLAPKVQKRIQKGETLRIISSVAGTGVPVAAAEQAAGVARACADKASGLKLDCRLVGPASTNTAAQLAELEALLNSNQVDCLSFQTGEPNAFVNIINRYVDAGIPVFGQNGDVADSKRFAYFALNESDAAKANAELTAAVMKKEGITPTKVAVGSGLPTAPWSQARMKGFKAGLEGAIPGVSFFNDAGSALPTGDGFTVAETITAVAPFLRGHSDVNLFFQNDQDVEGVGKVIEDNGLLGKVWASGFNVSNPILNSIDKGSILVTIDQGFDNQAQGAAAACVKFLATGEHPADPLVYLKPILITKDGLNGSMNINDARARLTKALS